MRTTRRSVRLIGAACILGLVAGCVSAVRFFALTTYTSADGHFRVDVPGGVMTDSSFAGSGAFARTTVHGLSHDADGMRFAVLYADADPSYLASTTIDAALAAAERANLSTIAGTQTSDLATVIEDNPSREQRIAGPNAFYRFHLVFIGNRFYSISVTGLEADVAGTEATTFLNSFAVAP